MNCCVAGNNTKSTKYDTDNNNDDDDNNNNLAVHDPWGDSFCPLFPGQIGIRNVGFCGGRKTRGPTEKPLEQGQEPKRNSIHIWRQVLELNPQATVMEGECSHHCTIPPPPNESFLKIKHSSSNS